MSCASATDLASFIWNDLGSPTNLSVAAIQTKLITDGYLGQFNVLTANCYSISGGSITPAMGNEELGMYGMMYERDYYTTKLNQLLNGDAIAWTRLTDGDSTVVRSSVVDIARVYRDMQQQLNGQLQMAIGSYRKGRAQPSSVDYFTFTNSRWYYGAYGGPVGVAGPGFFSNPVP